MADVGELVKLGNGRWARYQQCAVTARSGAPAPSGGMSVLVAVELDERTQRLLDAAEAASGLELDPAPDTRLRRTPLDPGSAPERVAALQ